MALSQELISLFAKQMTKNDKKSNRESTVYGTVMVDGNGNKYVKLDGSDQLTPLTDDERPGVDSTSANANAGERVSILIKNHTATVTGNISSPAARTDDVEDIGDQVAEIQKFDILVGDQLQANEAYLKKLDADKANVGELNAATAKITELEVNKANVTDLNAQNAVIEDLKVTKLDAEVANIKYATIENLNATNATITQLDAKKASIEQLEAHRAEIDEAIVGKLTTAEADLTYAKITDLNATNATVGTLKADVADIDTLIFGSASGTSIQTSFANAVIAQLGNAQIKAAMIQSIDAGQINAGDISTNKMRVVSDDGKLVISDETIQISDNNRVRVQIGKDSSNDYSINIWDESGNLMFSKGGITDKAIKDAIIRNDMVSEDANISASKLNISSLFTEINNSTETIKSTKIYLDDEKQTLDVAFTQMSSDLEDTKETVSSQGTQLSVVQGQIASKVWQQDINEATGDMSTRLSAIEQDIDGVTSTVASHTAQINDVANAVETAQATADTAKNNAATAQAKADQAAIDAAKAQQAADDADVKAAQAAADLVTAQQNLANVNSRVDATEEEIASARAAVETAQAAADKAKTDAAKAQSTADTAKANAATAQTAADNAKTAADKAQADVDAVKTRVTTAETKIEQNTEQIALRATKAEVTETLKGYYTAAQTDAAIKVSSNEITSIVSSTYATKDQVNAVNTRVGTAETKITQNTDAINLRATKSELNSALEGYYTKEETDTVITMGSSEIMSTVRDTTVTKTLIEDNGTPFVKITNAIADSIEGLKLYGKTAQNGTPTPSNPVELVSVGSGGTIKATVGSANLCDPTGFSNAAYYTVDEDGYITFTNNTQYDYYPRIDIPLPKGDYSITIDIASNDGCGIYLGTESINYNYIIKSDTIRRLTDTERVQILIAGKNGASCKVRFTVNAGTAALPYEPYKGQTLTVSTPNGLPGIPVSSGGNYTDENGQQWICDEIDFARGVYVQRVTRLLLNGTETFAVSTSENVYLYNISRYNSNLTSTDGSCDIRTWETEQRLVCSHFGVPDSYIASSARGDGTVCIYANNGQIQLGFKLSNKTLTEYATEQYAAGNPITLLYPRSTFIETLLSEEELTAFENLANPSGTLNIFSEAALEVTLSGMASASAVNSAQQTANQAQHKVDDAVVTITELQTVVQQLADSISMLVRDGTGGSMLRQDATGLWYFDISGIEESISDTANNVHDLSDTVHTATDKLDILMSTADVLRQKTEYVRSYTDENDNPCLELGEGDSKYRAYLTNNGIEFMDGTSTPTRLTRQMLIIEKAMVRNEFQFGDDQEQGIAGVWLWKRRANGNLGLMWKGVSS